ncbi:hypothetical protein ACFQ1S_30575, partial [Kibdelosporangium lantanae]
MRRLATIVGIASLAISGLSGATAQAGDKSVPVEPTPFSYMSPDVRAEMTAQQPIKAAASRIQRTIDGTDSTGYVGVGIGDGHVT